MFLKKTCLFGLLVAALAWVPLPNSTITAADQSTSISNELAWYGRWGGWGGRYGGYGWGGYGRGYGGWGGYGYYRPYYNYSPYNYYPYYYYPYNYRYWY